MTKKYLHLGLKALMQDPPLLSYLHGSNTYLVKLVKVRDLSKGLYWHEYPSVELTLTAFREYSPSASTSDLQNAALTRQWLCMITTVPELSLEIPRFDPEFCVSVLQKT